MTTDAAAGPGSFEHLRGLARRLAVLLEPIDADAADHLTSAADSGEEPPIATLVLREALIVSRRSWRGVVPSPLQREVKAALKEAKRRSAQ
jgi:hypothetical protein